MTKFAIKLSTLGAAIAGIVGGVVGFLAGLLIGSSLASTFNKLLNYMIGFFGTSTYTLIRKSGMLLPNANIVIKKMGARVDLTEGSILKKLNMVFIYWRGLKSGLTTNYKLIKKL
jgi:hypothetical protein